MGNFAWGFYSTISNYIILNVENNVDMLNLKASELVYYNSLSFVHIRSKTIISTVKIFHVNKD